MIEYERTSSSYILRINEKEINSAIYDLGTKYNRIAEGSNSSSLISDYYNIDEKPIDKSVVIFLTDANFVGAPDNSLIEDGKKYFESLYIHRDNETASPVIKQKLQRNPIVNLIGQVFYGRGKISSDQLLILLSYHKVANWEIDSKDIVSLLILLNRYDIAVYDKKNRLFYMKEATSIEEPIKQYYISPSTPFSNIYSMRKILRLCSGNIYWIDKHFRKEGLEIVLDGLAFEGVKSLTIISGTDNITESAKRDFQMLKQELNERAIVLSWRTIIDSSFKWHDRWIVSDDNCYNVPPVLAILRGQRADILKTDIILDICPFLEYSTDILQ